jgi:hypothetical protein
MNTVLKSSLAILLLQALFLANCVAVVAADQPSESSFTAPRSQTITVKMIGPVTQTTDLQIICVLKHVAGGDQYIEAMDDLNSKLGGLLSSLRDRDEFAGDLGETLLFTPPANTITPKRLLLIGIGEEKDLSPSRLELAGRIAAREAVRLSASHVSFAPTLRDQGSSRIDVAEGDAAVVSGWLLAYDTEQRMQEQGLAPRSAVSTLVIEAGPKYFSAASDSVGKAVRATAPLIEKRSTAPYVRSKRVS